MSSKSTQKSRFTEMKKNSNPTHSKSDDLEKKYLLGVGITNEKEDKILEYIIENCKNQQKNYYIVTPNPEMVVLANKDSRFKNVLNNAEIALNDGVGLSLGAWFLGKRLQERITGVDFMKNLCERLNDWPITVGFLGGGSKIAERVAECLKKEFSELKVVFAGDNPESLRSLSKDSIPDILFVALGFPKQEFWMQEHLGKIPVKVMMGVGGSFDYISGNVNRAPVWIRRVGFEWLFRLFVQPWRIRRQLALVAFVILICKAKITAILHKDG
ncbi:MAG: WecB/TagA/CpsF family glycosyltransferase [Candidatus Levyibacteriota bacterium]